MARIKNCTLCLTLVAILCVLAWAQARYEVATDQAAVIQVSGTVEGRPAGQSSWRPLVESSLLRAGDRIRTRSGSGAAILLSDQTIMKLAENTELLLVDLRLSENGNWIRRFQLQVGRVWSDVTPMERSDSIFEVRGPDAMAAVKGTAFEVEVDAEATEVRVWEGSVLATREDGQASDLVGADPRFAHNRFRVARGGAVSRSRFSSSQADPWQKWNLENRRALLKLRQSKHLDSAQLKAIRQRFKQSPLPARQRLRRGGAERPGPSPLRPRTRR
ncbi:MAG: FecR domain-containing protein [Vulcanimicrobiota bacterium]